MKEGLQIIVMIVFGVMLGDWLKRKVDARDAPAPGNDLQIPPEIEARLQRVLSSFDESAPQERELPKHLFVLPRFRINLNDVDTDLIDLLRGTTGEQDIAEDDLFDNDFDDDLSPIGKLPGERPSRGRHIYADGENPVEHDEPELPPISSEPDHEEVPPSNSPPEVIPGHQIETFMLVTDNGLHPIPFQMKNRIVMVLRETGERIKVGVMASPPLSGIAKPFQPGFSIQLNNGNTAQNAFNGCSTLCFNKEHSLNWLTGMQELANKPFVIIEDGDNQISNHTIARMDGQYVLEANFPNGILKLTLSSQQMGWFYEMVRRSYVAAFGDTDVGEWPLGETETPE